MSIAAGVWQEDTRATLSPSAGQGNPVVRICLISASVSDQDSGLFGDSDVYFRLIRDVVGRDWVSSIADESNTPSWGSSECHSFNPAMGSGFFLQGWDKDANSDDGLGQTRTITIDFSTAQGVQTEVHRAFRRSLADDRRSLADDTAHTACCHRWLLLTPSPLCPFVEQALSDPGGSVTFSIETTFPTGPDTCDAIASWLQDQCSRNVVAHFTIKPHPVSPAGSCLHYYPSGCAAGSLEAEWSLDTSCDFGEAACLACNAEVESSCGFTDVVTKYVHRDTPPARPNCSAAQDKRMTVA